MTSPSSMTCRGSMIMSWLFMVYWISLMMVRLAASIPSTWATSMTWFDDVCSPITPMRPFSRLPTPRDIETTNLPSPYTSADRNLRLTIPCHLSCPLHHLYLWCWWRPFGWWEHPEKIIWSERTTTKPCYNSPSQQQRAMLAWALVVGSTCPGYRHRFSNGFFWVWRLWTVWDGTCK